MLTPNNLKLAALLTVAAVMLQVPAFAGDEADKTTEKKEKKSKLFKAHKKQVAMKKSETSEEEAAGYIPAGSPEEFVNSGDSGSGG